MRRNKDGFSLLEIMIAVAIIGLTFVSLLRLFSAGLTSGTRAKNITIATNLAQELMEEIIAKNYQDPQTGSATWGPEGGEVARTGYDDIDDYDGLNNTPPKDIGNNNLTDFPNFRRQAVVQNVQNNDYDTVLADNGSESKKITVMVGWANGSQSIQLVSVKTK